MSVETNVYFSLLAKTPLEALLRGAADMFDLKSGGAQEARAITRRTEACTSVLIIELRHTICIQAQYISCKWQSNNTFTSRWKGYTGLLSQTAHSHGFQLAVMEGSPAK